MYARELIARKGASRSFSVAESILSYPPFSSHVWRVFSCIFALARSHPSFWKCLSGPVPRAHGPLPLGEHLGNPATQFKHHYLYEILSYRQN